MQGPLKTVPNGVQESLLVDRLACHLHATPKSGGDLVMVEG